MPPQTRTKPEGAVVLHAVRDACVKGEAFPVALDRVEALRFLAASARLGQSCRSMPAHPLASISNACTNAREAGLRHDRRPDPDPMPVA